METPALSPAARWPHRLVELCASLRAGPGTRDSARAEAWLLVREALLRYIRCYASRFRAAGPEDIEDLASAKALELLTRAESGEWNPDGRHPGELAGYLAAVARNGLARLAEHRRREPAFGSPSEDGDAMEFETEDRRSPAPHTATEAHEFVETLRRCVEALQPRARRVWFFRAFFEMTSRDIASHPQVGISPAHVDVVVQRARDALRHCLGSKGLAPRDYPAGTFSLLWESLGTMAEDVPSPTGASDGA